MSWSRERLDRANLYLILDTGVLPYQDLLKVLKPAVRSGVDIVQLRDKRGGARDMLAFCRQAKRITADKALFIVNDRIDIALLSDADGVHLGQEDIGCLQARAMMGKKALVGVSCQRQSHLIRAQKDRADYVGFGSVFKTMTKPERDEMDPSLLGKAAKTARLPLFAIGGITAENLEHVLSLGVQRVAVCRDILLAKRPDVAVGNLKKLLRNSCK